MLFLLACFQRLYLVHHFVRYYHRIVQDGVSDPVFHNFFWKTVPVKILELICEDFFFFFFWKRRNFEKTKLDVFSIPKTIFAQTKTKHKL